MRCDEIRCMQIVFHIWFLSASSLFVVTHWFRFANFHAIPKKYVFVSPYSKWLVLIDLSWSDGHTECFWTPLDVNEDRKSSTKLELTLELSLHIATATGEQMVFDIKYLIVSLNAINEDETILEPDERLWLVRIIPLYEFNEVFCEQNFIVRFFLHKRAHDVRW